MVMSYGANLSLTRRYKRLLRKLTITMDAPGTILHDFDAILTYVKEQRLRVTGTHQLPLRSLAEINARLVHPLELGFQRPVQKSFPPIHGLYLLLRASGLTYLDESGSKPFLIVDEDLYQMWESLSPTDRYCTLLEIWLFRASDEIVGERSLSGLPLSFQKWIDFFARLRRDSPAAFADRASLSYTPGWHNLGLLTLFGLIDVRSGPPVKGEGWRIEEIRRTPLGEAMLALLFVEFFQNIDRVLALSMADSIIQPGVLQPVLQPYFPEWQHTLPIPTDEDYFRDGIYVLKVALWDDCWRRFAVPGALSFDNLASAILDAYAFDPDHLYHFCYETRFGTQKYLTHPYMDEGPYASEVAVGSIPLREGQTIEFLYDFGDQWEFDVTLERMDPVDPQLQTIKLLASEGEAPEQYPRWSG